MELAVDGCQDLVPDGWSAASLIQQELQPEPCVACKLWIGAPGKLKETSYGAWRGSWTSYVQKRCQGDVERSKKGEESSRCDGFMCVVIMCVFVCCFIISLWPRNSFNVDPPSKSINGGTRNGVSFHECIFAAKPCEL